MVCGDDDFTPFLIDRFCHPKGCGVITYGFSDRCTIRGTGLVLDDDACPTFCAELPDEQSFEVHLPIPGKHNARNALAAIMLFGCFAVEEPAAIFVLVVLLIICLYFALYPLFFVLCMRRVRTAALQMNSWRAGMPSEQGAAGANGPRVTLDDVINS